MATKALNQAAALAAVVLAAGEAAARDPIMPGNAVNSHAGLGAVVGDDPTALFYNPARLAGAGGWEAFGEVSLARIAHGYRHPEFERFAIEVVAPLVAVGGVYGLSGDDAAIGVVAFPTGVDTKATFAGLPVDLTPTDAARSTVSARQSGYELGVGGRLRVQERVWVGLALVRSYKSNEVQIDVDGADAPLLRSKVQGALHRVQLGLRADVDRWTLGLALALPSVRRYEGKTSMPALGYVDPYATEMADYAPLEVTTGLARAFGRWSLGFEYGYERYGAGREIARTGMNPQDARESNLNDAHAASVHGDWRWRKSCGAVGGGLGYVQGNMGSGTYMESGGKDNLGISGMRFGNFEAIDRVAAGAAWSCESGRRDIRLGGFASYGRKVVEEGKPQQGAYDFLMLAITAAYAHAF